MKQLYFLILTNLFLISAYSQVFLAPSVQWTKCFGSTGTEIVSSVQPTSDNGYITIGFTNGNNGDISQNHGKLDVLVVKLNNLGTIQWQRCYGGTEDDFGSDIKQTSDGGYILVGSSESNNGDVTLNKGFGDVWIVKINSIGNIEWQRSYGSSKVDVASSIQLTSTGGYMVAGQCGANDGDVTGFRGGSADAWVLRLDNVGSILWQKSFGGNKNEYANNIVVSTANEIVFTGSTNSEDGDVSGLHSSPMSNNSDMWVVKLSTLGELQWQKCFGSTAIDEGRDIKQTEEGGYIIAGSAGVNNGDVSGARGAIDMWAVKINSAGALEWQKAIGGTDQDYGYKIIQTPEGGFLLGGWVSSYDGDVDKEQRKSNYDFWLVKLNNSGTLIQWQKILGGENADLIFGLEVIPGGGYIVGGATNSNTGDVNCSNATPIELSQNSWVIKLNEQVLPLTLTLFSAIVVNKITMLRWTTMRESATDYFYVQRSLNGISFSNIGKVEAQGYTSGSINYAYDDTTAPLGKSQLYYRLQVIDKDGSYNYSNIQVVSKSPVAASFYPNPAREAIYFNSLARILEVKIYNSMGKLVIIKNSPAIQILDISTLPSGLYVLVLKTNETTKTSKLLIK